MKGIDLASRLLTWKDINMHASIGCRCCMELVLGLVHTSNFSCAEPNVNELKQRT